MKAISEKQHVIITGTTKGLGNFLCQQLLDEGYAVTGFARSEIPDEFRMYELNGSYLHIVSDLSHLKNVDLVYSEIIKKKTRYLIINAADYSIPHVFNQEVFSQQITLNLLFPVHLIQNIISNKQEVPLKIIFISSIMADIYDAKIPMYGAAKSTISHFIGGLQMQRHPNVSFLKVTIGPMVDTAKPISFIKQIVSRSYKKAAAKIVLNLNRNRSEIFIPGLWRYVIYLNKITGTMLISRLLNKYR